MLSWSGEAGCITGSLFAAAKEAKRDSGPVSPKTVSVKSSSSVELCSLYWQIEVSAVVTTRFETLVLGKGALCLLQSHGEVIFFFTFCSAQCRMIDQVLPLRIRVVEVGVGLGWRVVTAASTYQMAVPLWPPHVMVNSSKICYPVYVRREAFH